MDTGAPNDPYNYDADMESLMGRGMELRLDDFNEWFCARVKTGEKDCDPWKGHKQKSMHKNKEIWMLVVYVVCLLMFIQPCKTDETTAQVRERITKRIRAILTADREEDQCRALRSFYAEVIESIAPITGRTYRVYFYDKNGRLLDESKKNFNENNVKYALFRDSNEPCYFDPFVITPIGKAIGYVRIQ